MAGIPTGNPQYFRLPVSPGAGQKNDDEARWAAIERGDEAPLSRRESSWKI
jgi:hypothetical protein